MPLPYVQTVRTIPTLQQLNYYTILLLISHNDFNFFIAEEIMKSQLNNGIVVTGVLVGNLNLDLKSNAKVVSDTSSYI